MESKQTSNDVSELSLAAELQASLLPKACPERCENFAAAARNRMCGSVGGDFYDFIRLNDEQIAVVIGDVSGHGVRAALVMSQLMGFLRWQGELLSRPAQAVSSLNRMLLDLGERNGSVMSCSIFYAVIDIPTSTGFFVNAGHPCPYLLKPSAKTSLQELVSHSLLLGVQEYPPEEMCHTFLPGQRLVMYTDGVLDAINPAGDRFGTKSLKQALIKGAGLPADQLAESLMQKVKNFEEQANQLDDQTIVVIDRLSPAAIK